MSDNQNPKMPGMFRPEVPPVPTPSMPVPAIKPQATPNPPQPFTPPSESVISSVSSNRVSFFKIFIVIALVVIVIIYALVVYLYLQNKKSKESLGGNQVQVSAVPTATLPKPFQIKIKNGNVVKEIEGEVDTVLVSKEDYPSVGITGFVKVNLSEDKTRICFESLPPAPKPASYIANIDGTNVVKITDNKQSCTWNKNSQSVFYTSIASQNASINIFQYDIASQTEKDLTVTSIPANTVRQYKIVGLSADFSKLMCQYEDVSPTPRPSFIPSGQCEINLVSQEVKLL